MASEIEIAFWPRGPSGPEYFRSLLDRYSQQKRSAQIRATWLNEKNPWSDVSQTMIHRSGADVTEIGASWVESLVATHSLRPFSAQEFQSFGGNDAFIQPAWEKAGDTGLVYSIPDTIDARHFYYRRDLLAKAGVDVQTAFATPQNFLQTLESLKQAGIQSPLVMPIASAHMNLSFVASWIWGAGADFTNPAGNQATFDGPEAISAIADYFRAAEYIAPEFRQMDVLEADTVFCEGNAAIVLSGSWLFYRLHGVAEYAHTRENLGIASTIGHTYRGGTHLVIWQHCVQQETALDLIRFLTSTQVQADVSARACVLPARLEATQFTSFANDPNYQMLVKTVLSGRSYGASPFWNIVEARLSNMLVQLWPEYFNTPGMDANAFLASRLSALARRINITLE